MNWVKSMRKRRKDNGQGMVEFALVLPLLLLVMFGIIEFGRLFFSYAMVSASSREGARYGAAVGDVGGIPYYKHCTGIKDAAIRIGAFAGVSTGNVIIDYDHGPTSGSFGYTTSCTSDLTNVSTVGLGDRIIVTTTVTYQPIVPLVNVPPITLSSATRRTFIKDVPIDSYGPPTPAY